MDLSRPPLRRQEEREIILRAFELGDMGMHRISSALMTLAYMKKNDQRPKLLEIITSKDHDIESLGTLSHFVEEGQIALVDNA